MPAKPIPRVKTTVYLTPDTVAQLKAKRKASGGISTAQTIRIAIDQHLNPKPVAGDYDEIEIVRRAIMSGGMADDEFTISNNEFGKNFNASCQDPVTGKWVYLTGLIAERGWPQHAAASINTTAFCVSDILSPAELATANEALCGVVK